MPLWSTTVTLSNPEIDTTASEEQAAVAEVESLLLAVLPLGWEVAYVALVVTYIAGDWVLVRTPGGPEYATVVDDAGTLKAAIGNGTLRPMSAVIRRA